MHYGISPPLSLSSANCQLVVIYICTNAYAIYYMADKWVIIRVNAKTRDSLHDLKKRTRLSSMDAVIDYLLSESKLTSQTQIHEPPAPPLPA